MIDPNWLLSFVHVFSRAHLAQVAIQEKRILTAERPEQYGELMKIGKLRRIQIRHGEYDISDSLPLQRRCDASAMPRLR